MARGSLSEKQFALMVKRRDAAARCSGAVQRQQRQFGVEATCDFNEKVYYTVSVVEPLNNYSYSI